MLIEGLVESKWYVIRRVVASEVEDGLVAVTLGVNFLMPVFIESAWILMGVAMSVYSFAL